MHLLSQVIYSCKTLYMFRSFRPSSGAQNCVYSNGICKTAAATCCYSIRILLSKIIYSCKRSTCFGRSFRPSSGAQNCVYSNGICQTAAATCCYSTRSLLSQIIYSCKTLYMFRTVFAPIIRSSKMRVQQRYMSNSCCYLLL